MSSQSTFHINRIQTGAFYQQQLTKEQAFVGIDLFQGWAEDGLEGIRNISEMQDPR